MFKDVDDLTEIEYDAELYPKRKSQAEIELEKELKKDSAASEKEEKAEKAAEKQEQEKKAEEKNKTNKNKDENQIKSEKEQKDKKIEEKETKTEKVEEKTEKISNKSKIAKKKFITKKSDKVEQTPDKKTEEKETKKQQEKTEHKKTKSDIPKTTIIEDEEKNNWALIAASALVIVAIIVALYFAFSAAKPSTETNNILAIVNGEPIYASKLDFRERTLQSLGLTNLDKNEILNEIINERLILQDAKKEKIIITENEAENALQERMLVSGISPENLKTSLEEQNIKYEEMVTFYKESLIVNKYMNETLRDQINTSEEVLKQYYKNNEQAFIMPNAVRVRHILIMYGNETQNETYTKAKKIIETVNANNTNFCDLVKEHTDDIASKETCGEYNFTEQDPLVPEFKAAGFKLKPKEKALIKTQFGYHIMLKMEDMPGGKLLYEEVKDQIKEAIIQQELLKEYDKKIEELKENAIIEIYSQEEKNVTTTQTTIDITEPTKTTNETEKTETSTSSSSTKVQIVNTKAATLQKQVECISENAKMYTVDWSPYNTNQYSYFEDYAESIVTIDCEQESCNPAIKSYPAWIINGEVYNGVQSLTKLLTLTGC